MKKILLTSFILISFIFCIGMITACSNSSSISHTHNMVKQEEVFPTCEENGNKEYYYCSICNKIFSDMHGINEIKYEDTILQSAGHRFSLWSTIKLPSCSEPGTNFRNCLNCNYVEYESIPLLDHTYGNWYQTKTPTCTETGLETRECSVCDHFETKIMDMVDHTYGNWYQTKAPTCTETGLETRECSTCDHFETKIKGTIDHTFGDWYQTKAPTCISTGSEERVCTYCGKILETRTIPKLDHSISENYLYNADTHWKACSSCHQELYEEDHVFDNGVNNEGVKIFTCMICGYEKEELPTKLDAYGTGTNDDPFLIYSGEQIKDLFLSSLWESDISKISVKLMRDISIDPSEYLIRFRDSERYYTCIFDGNNKSITSTSISLFPYLPGTLKDLTVYISPNDAS